MTLSTAELLLIFVLLPILCAIVCAGPFLFALGKFLDWQDLADKRAHWLIQWTTGFDPNADVLLRPAPLPGDRNHLLRTATEYEGLLLRVADDGQEASAENLSWLPKETLAG